MNSLVSIHHNIVFGIYEECFQLLKKHFCYILTSCWMNSNFHSSLFVCRRLNVFTRLRQMERLQKQTFPESHRERERNKSSSERRSFLQRHKMGLFQLPGFNDVIAPQFWILITEHSLFLCLGSTAHTCHYSVILRWLLQLDLSRGGGIKSPPVPHLRSPKHSVCTVVSSCRQQRLVILNFSHYRHCHYCHHSHKLRHGGHHCPKRCRLKREKGGGECVWWF